MESKVTILKSELEPSYAKDVEYLKVSDTVLEKLGKELGRRFKTLATMQERSQWEEDNAESLAAYLMEPPKKELPYEGYPNLRCPLTRIGVDSYHAQTKYSIFGNDNMAEVKPVYISKQYITKTDKASTFLTYQLNHESGFYKSFDAAAKDDGTIGIGFLEPRYVKEFKWETRIVEKEVQVPEIDPMSGELTMITQKTKKKEKKKVTVFDGIKIDRIDPELIYVSPFFEDFEEAKKHDVVFKKIPGLKLRDIKRDAKSHEDHESLYIKSQVDKIEVVVRASLFVDERSTKQVLQEYDGFDQDYICEDQVVELVQGHCWYDVDGDDIPEQVTVVFEPRTGTVIRVALAPCRIVAIKSRPIPGRLRGESFYKAGKSICDEWESMHNGRVAKVDWSNLPIIFYRAGGRFDPQTITLTPGKAYPMDDPGSVSSPQFPPPMAPSYQEEQLLFNYWERIFGLSENMQGVSSSRESSATERIQVSQASSIKLSSPIARVIGSIELLLGYMWDLNRDCAPADKEFYIVGASKAAPMFQKMSREDYSAQMKFKMAVQTVFDEQMMRDTWMLAYKTFMMNPMVAAHPAAMYQLTTNTLRGMHVQLDIPKPPQAEALSPLEIIELYSNEEFSDPIPGEDYDEHLKQYASFVKTEQFAEWDAKIQQAFLERVDKMKILKQTLEASNLNKSGVFEGMPGGQGAAQPGAAGPRMTVSRNPSEAFNRARVNDSADSQINNAEQQGGQY